MAQGIPGTITYNWYRNGVLVSTTDTVGSYSLVVDVNSIGVYECVPVNIHGTHNTSSVLVNVKGEWTYMYIVLMWYTDMYMYMCTVAACSENIHVNLTKQNPSMQYICCYSVIACLL